MGQRKPYLNSSIAHSHHRCRRNDTHGQCGDSAQNNESSLALASLWMQTDVRENTPVTTRVRQLSFKCVNQQLSLPQRKRQNSNLLAFGTNIAIGDEPNVVAPNVGPQLTCLFLETEGSFRCNDS